MDHYTSASRKTQKMAYTDDKEAIKTVIGMLSPAVAAETASFSVDCSLQLYPEAMRGHPDTLPATSLREYHFTVLMAQVARAYADGRGQDFADGRSAIDSLLQEEPDHQPLALRFGKLMGLWLQEAHDKRQREELEKLLQEVEEELEAENSEDSEESESEEAIEASRESRVRNNSNASQESASSSTASADSQHVPEEGDEVDGSPAATRPKSVFDPSGQITTDDSSEDDEDSSSDEEEITYH